LSSDPKEEKTTEKDNDNCKTQEKDGKYRIVLKCSLSLDSEEKSKQSGKKAVSVAAISCIEQIITVERRWGKWPGLMCMILRT